MLSHACLAMSRFYDGLVPMTYQKTNSDIVYACVIAGQRET